LNGNVCPSPDENRVANSNPVATIFFMDVYP
jgi:hypothetical protein